MTSLTPKDREQWRREAREDAENLGLLPRVQRLAQRILALDAALTAKQQEINDAWWVLGHAYSDQYGVLAEALKGIAKQIEVVEGPRVEPYCEGFEQGKATNETLMTLSKRRADRLQGEVNDLRAALTAKDEALAQMTRERNELSADLHLLKRAVSPSRAGHAPWDGMPDITYFVGVALHMREREAKVGITSAAEAESARITAQVAELERLRELEAKVTDNRCDQVLRLQAQLEAAEAQVARLTEALREIAHGLVGADGMYWGDHEAAKDALLEARAALAPGQPETGAPHE